VKAQQPTLLNLLGVAQIMPDVTPRNAPQTDTPSVFDMIFQSFMAETKAAPMADMPSAESATFDQATSAFAVQPEMQPIDEPIDGLTIEMPLPAAQGVTEAFAASPIKSPRILEVTTTALPQGSFSVTATTIENGVVTFDLTSGNAGQSLQVSVPLETIDTHLEGSMNRSHHSIGSFATIRDGIDIEQLLARVNVTSVDISTTPRADATQSIIAINANQQGKAISLFAIPHPAEIVVQALPVAQVLLQPIVATPQQRAKSSGPEASIETVTVRFVPTGDLSGESSLIVDSDRIDVIADPDLDSDRGMTATTKSLYSVPKTNSNIEKSAIESQWGQQLQADTANINEIPTTNNVPTDNATLGEPSNSPVASALRGGSIHQTETAGMQVNHLPHSALTKNFTVSDFGTQLSPKVQASFTLPKDLEAMTLHAGKTNSVTLQLNPEHLGTARVHLTVQDDVVSARVVVESHHAKAVVEGSLNELLTQFERANIRVEQIQIAVSGEWQNSEHNRRQFWHAPRSSARLTKDSGDVSDSITAAVEKLFAPKQTPAFAGLNILA
jgi:flagellar hook-length control protein FliK